MMLGMSTASKHRKVTSRTLEERGHGDGALSPAVEIEHPHRLRVGRTRIADDERPARALLARIRQRLLERPADDVARHRPSEIAEATGQGERARLLRREVDDEEVRAGQIDRRALRLHGEERAPDLEGEAGGRTLVAEA